MRPLVSILTPSYNQSAWLRHNLASVSCQTYPHIEHIVMDGGSTDGSVDVLAQAGDTIRWRSEPDRGQADAVNKALMESSGEIIGWLNSDDAYYHTRVIEDVVRTFEENPDADVVYGHAACVDAEGRIIYIIWVPPFNARRLMWFDYIVQPAAFIRRRVVTAPLLDIDFEYAMDWELWLRLARSSARFKRMDRVLAIDRVHPARKSKNLRAVWERDAVVLAERYGRYYPSLWGLYERAYMVVARVMGTPHAVSVPDDVCFGARQDAATGLVRRQAFQRRSKWPEEYR